MSDTSINNKRIAKNTLMLYVRMLLLMAVSLYTSRVVLDKLGVTDYGIYNVVGGVVALLGFLSGAMANAVQRFLSYEIGRGDKESVRNVFSVSVQAHCLIAVFVLIIMEIVGVWYLNTHMNIPNERLSAANWVLQCTLFATMFSIVQVPYNAIIIAKEEMGIYAYISILEAVLKLAIVYLLGLWNFDRLKLYSLLTMVVTVIILTIYHIYCVRKYEEANFKPSKDFKTLKDITSFAGWNMFGELAWVFSIQGVNIILNLFFGPEVNAARGIAVQVNGAVSRFVNSFQTAVNPQIIKGYASDQYEETKTLLFRSTRFSYYLMLLLSLPLILNMDFILRIWLKSVPEYTGAFCKLVLISTLISTISNLLPQIARASGKIRTYQIVVSAFLFLNFPLSYLVLRLGASPLATMTVNIAIQTILIAVRLLLTKNMVKLSIKEFVKQVLCPILAVSIISPILPWYCQNRLDESWITFIIICTVSILCTSFGILTIGMKKNERQLVLKSVSGYCFKILHRQ